MTKNKKTKENDQLVNPIDGPPETEPGDNQPGRGHGGSTSQSSSENEPLKYFLIAVGGMALGIILSMIIG